MRKFSPSDYNEIKYSEEDFNEDQQEVRRLLKSNVIQFPPRIRILHENAGTTERLRINTTDPMYKASMHFIRKYGELSAAYYLRHMAVTQFVRQHLGVLVRKGLAQKPSSEDGRDATWVDDAFFRYLLQCRMSDGSGRFSKSVIGAYFTKTQ